MGDVALRPMRPGEMDAICALINRANVHDRIPQVVDVAELTEDIAEADPATDLRVADVDGELSGYVLAFFVPAGERLERAFVFGWVDPARRGLGVGSALVAWATERAREQLEACGSSLPKFIRAEVYEQVADAHELFQQHGYEAVRWFEELLRPLGELPPVDVDPAYEIVSWPVDRAEEVLAVRNEAFAEHWGSVPWSMHRFREVSLRYSARLDLSVVAVERESGGIVGVCFNEHYPNDAELIGRTDGWISVLGTRAAHRGRGLASAMIRASLARFADAGFTHASIGVDSASPTGANRLYRALGFRPEQQHTTYQITLP